MRTRRNDSVLDWEPEKLGELDDDAELRILVRESKIFSFSTQKILR